MNIEDIIVRRANEIAEKDFSGNYEPDCPLDFQGAVAYLIGIELQDVEDLDSSEIYDFLTTKIKK
jgi:hypothetical protein